MLRDRKILIVDADAQQLEMLRELLRHDYRVSVAESGREAYALLTSGAYFDLLLLSSFLPDADGSEVCRRLKGLPAAVDLPVIMLSRSHAIGDELAALAAGAVDFIALPVTPALLMARVKTHLQSAGFLALLRNQNALLEQRVGERSRELEQRFAELTETRELAILALAGLAETRDFETGNHIRRTQHYVHLLARHLSAQTRFRPLLDDATVEQLRRSAPLHDIGKVGIPDRILLKPGRLDESEFALMKTHTVLGHAALQTAMRGCAGEVSGFLRHALEIARSHHERWDGSGYPDGLRGEEIPLSARLMSVADVYDALISQRPYKQPYTHEDACALIRNGAGKAFDPAVVEAFDSLHEIFQQTANMLSD